MGPLRALSCGAAAGLKIYDSRFTYSVSVSLESDLAWDLDDGPIVIYRWIDIRGVNDQLYYRGHCALGVPVAALTRNTVAKR